MKNAVHAAHLNLNVINTLILITSLVYAHQRVET